MYISVTYVSKRYTGTNYEVWFKDVTHSITFCDCLRRVGRTYTLKYVGATTYASAA